MWVLRNFFQKFKILGDFSEKSLKNIWGTPFPAILNQKNSTGSAGGAKNSQNGGILVTPNKVVWKINFSQVAKISCRLVQKWPRYKKKPQKWTLKNDFSEKSPRILNFWKKFLKTHMKRANLAETDISGHEIYPKGPSWPMCIDMVPPLWWWRSWI